MPRKSYRRTSHKRTFLIISLIAALGVAAYFVYQNMVLQSQLEGFETTSEATSYKFIIYDALNSSNTDEMRDAASIHVYGKNVEGYTDEEVQDLTFADFSLVKTLDSNDTFTPEDNYVYVFKINGTDIVPKYYVSDFRLFNAKVPIAALGTIDVYLYNETEDVAILAYSDNIFSTTFNQTDYRDWTLIANCLDRAEGADAKVTDAQGWESHFDPETNADDNVFIMIDFNTTAHANWVTYQNSDEYTITVANDKIFISISRNIAGSEEFDFRLGSGLGTDFEVEQIVFGHGSPSSYTAWDTQA